MKKIKKSIKLKERNENRAVQFFNLGTGYHQQQQFDQAITCYQKALQLDTNLVPAYNNLGTIFQETGQIDKAINFFQKALQTDPNYTAAGINMGSALQLRGDLDESIEYFRNAIRINPDNVDAHVGISHSLLLLGNYKDGWEENEWRMKTKDFIHQQRNLPQPCWDGSSLKGKTLFVYAEQGIGDEIMFASCLPDVIEKADLCLVECDARLVPLFQRSFPKSRILARTENNIFLHDLPPIDYKISIASLPKFFRNNLSSFPKRRAYLTPDIKNKDSWKSTFNELGEGLKIGISWKGGRIPRVRQLRSILLEQWSALFSFKGVHFINLQYGDCTDEIRHLKDKLGVVINYWEHPDPLKDLDSFAAQISALDLVISVDNSTVHMGGSLGVPVWVLLPYACDWRWMRDFEDTPWYETVRLFRQSSPGDWHGVLERVHTSLLEAVKNGFVSVEQWRMSLMKSCMNKGMKNELLKSQE